VVKSALIFADDANGLEQVYRIPAVRRLALLTCQLGFEKIHVISRDASLFTVLSDLVGIIEFHHLEDELHLSGIVEKLQFHDEESVLVLKANHIIDRWSLDRLLQAQQDKDISFLAKDEARGAERIFLVKASHLLPLLSSLRTSERSEVEIEASAIRVKASPGLPELLDGTRRKVKVAEAALIAALGRSSWERDGILARHVSRPISRLISPTAIRVGMTANAVTLCITIIGLAGAALLFIGGYLFQVFGSLMFLFSVIADGVDGEVARLRLQESKFGHYLDIICDNIVHIAIFIGVAIGLYRETANGIFIYLLWFFLGGIGLCALILNRILAERHVGVQRSQLAITCEALFNNRDFAYLMLALALFHRLDWFFVAAAFGSYLLAGILWVADLVTRRKKQ